MTTIRKHVAPPCHERNVANPTELRAIDSPRTQLLSQRERHYT